MPKNQLVRFACDACGKVHELPSDPLAREILPEGWNSIAQNIEGGAIKHRYFCPSHELVIRHKEVIARPAPNPDDLDSLPPY